MQRYKLKKEEWEDFNDSLRLLELSLSIQFQDDELIRVTSFLDLTALAINKVNAEDDQVCTTQIAFYQIRKVVKSMKLYDSNYLKPSTKLCDIFPRKNRRKKVKQFEKELGVKSTLLEMNSYLGAFLLLLSIFSVCIFFINFVIGIIAVAINILMWIVAITLTKKLRINTIRELIESIIFENYLLFRKDRNTINKKEFSRLMIKWFADNMALEEEQIEYLSFK